MVAFRLTRAASAFVAVVVVLGMAAPPARAIASSCQAVATAPAPVFARLVPAAFVGSVAADPWRSLRAVADETVELTFLGHASFLIRSATNVTAVTDYNGYIRAPSPPDIVTMNHAHGTHYTDTVEPGVGHILRGWNTGTGIPHYDLTLRDLHVRNVPTNIRDGYAGTEFGGNSIFIFETAGLCIAHLGHLHHQLEPGHLAQIGIVDVLLAPIDDGYTMPQTGMVKVIETLQPAVVIPMHYAGPDLLASFAALMRERGWAIREAAGPTVRFGRATLPRKTVLVLPSDRF